MDDSLERAMRASDAKAAQQSQGHQSIVGAAQARADALAQEASEALQAALSGYKNMSQPVANIAHGRRVGERTVAVETSGAGLEIVATVTVGWEPGDGVNIGHGQSSKIAVEVSRGFVLHESFAIPVPAGGPILAGHFSVDRDGMKRQIIDAIGRMPG